MMFRRFYENSSKKDNSRLSEAHTVHEKPHDRSNENNYRQTDPNQVKKIFKSIKGILSYLKAKMQYNTRKHGKHINPH